MWPWPIAPDSDTASPSWPWPAGNAPLPGGPVDVEQPAAVQKQKIGRPKRDRAEIKRRRKAARRA